MRTQATRRRSGATTLEVAIVLPTTFVLLIGLLVGGILVFKYQEIAHIAHETSRYASVHGNQYYRQNSALITAQTIPNVTKDYLVSYAKGKAVSIPSDQLTVSVQLLSLPLTATSNSGATLADWSSTNNSPYSTYTSNGTTYQACNTVTVTVSTTWNPGIYLLGSISLQASSTMPMSY